MELEIGKIVTFEPSDSFEYGVIYRVEDDGQQAMAAFLNECCGMDSVYLRQVRIKDGKVLVKSNYRANVRDGQKGVSDVFDWDDGAIENYLVFIMKTAVNNPDDLAPSYQSKKDGYMYTNKQWPCRLQFSRFRRAVCDILVRCEWARMLWTKCPNGFKEANELINGKSNEKEQI